jgi:hypothetical protein
MGKPCLRMAGLLMLTVEQGDISYRLRSTIVYIRFVRTPCKSAWATAYSPRKLLEFRVVSKVIRTNSGDIYEHSMQHHNNLLEAAMLFCAFRTRRGLDLNIRKFIYCFSNLCL